LGVIFDRNLYSHGRRSTISREAKSAIAFTWVWNKLSAGQMPEDLEVWHEGRCSKCGRQLTDPVSISVGMGPTCRGEAR